MFHRRSVPSGGLLLAALAAASIALALLAAAPSRNGSRPRGDIKRGEYLATITGCGDCHTPGTFYGAPDPSRRLSGSELGWQGPWGVTYPRNLTPDKVTGLGTWSEEDIVRAITRGIRPDKSPIFPPMPWQDFSMLSRQDAYAIAAYLKSLPPIRHLVPPRLMPGSKGPGGRVWVLPPPPAWDAPRKPPAPEQRAK